MSAYNGLTKIDSLSPLHTATMLCFVQGITQNRKDSEKEKVPKKGRLIKSRSASSVSIGDRTAPNSPMAPLQGQSELHGQSVTNLTTLFTKSPTHQEPTNKTDPKHLINSAREWGVLEQSNKKVKFAPLSQTYMEVYKNASAAESDGTSEEEEESLKQQSQISQSTVPVASSSGRSLSPHQKSSSSSSTISKNEIPEKEKKRKELSSSRQKKFQRHFQQVSKDERVINYFSCALVSDILLQGHLYITENYFAFYSNVFGFVTKLLIPTASVIKISKEKTAKIIPNAVGVATADERHVFGSFMSREAAFRLMCSVCPPLIEPIENIPKVPDVEVSEEYSIEDDSSCSISGNESPSAAITGIIITGAGAVLDTAASDASHQIRQRNNIHLSGGSTGSGDGAGIGQSSTTTDSCDLNLHIPSSSSDKAKLCSSSNSPSKNSSLKLSATAASSSSPSSIGSSNEGRATIRFKFPTDFHVVYIGVILSIILALFSGFLLYRILDIEAKTNYKSSIDFNWGTGSDIEIYAEALKWQKEMQAKSTEEAQLILNSNLQQIARVRKSLETLSMLIHDRSPYPSNFDSTNSEDHHNYDINDENSSIDHQDSTA